MTNMVTKTGLNYFASKLWNNKIKPIQTQLNNHTHTSFNNDLSVNGKLKTTKSIELGSGVIDTTYKCIDITRKCTNSETDYTHTTSRIGTVDADGGCLGLELRKNDVTLIALRLTNGLFYPTSSGFLSLGSVDRKFSTGFFSSYVNCEEIRVTAGKGVLFANDDRLIYNDTDNHFSFISDSEVFRSGVKAGKFVADNNKAVNSSCFLAICNDANGSGDGNTHIGYWSNGVVNHYFRGKGSMNVDMSLKARALYIDGKKLSITTSAPASPTTGDVWIQI